MTTTLTGKNQVTVPVELVKQMGLQTGARLDWQAGSSPGTILIRVQPSIRQRLARAQEIGKPYTGRDFVEELRLVSNKGGAWDYTAGLFYQRQHINSGETDFIRGFVNWFNAARAADPAFAPFYPPGQLTSERDFFYNRDEKFTSKAVFGELTYHFNDAHQVSLGARYFADEADITTDVAPSLPIFSNEEIHALAPIKQSKPLFKASYSWHMTPDNMLYVTASQGYRRGGANGIPITGLLRERPEWQSYKDDNINNFEVGFKGFNERFSYSATAFLINWKDIQINTATPTWGYYATSNVGSARSKGTELELSGRLAQRWRYTLSFTYIDAQLTSTGYIPSAVTAAAPTVVIAQAGERLPAVPKVLASASTSYRAPVGPAVSFFGTLGVSFQGSQLNALKGDRDNLGVTLGSYSIWNATTGFDFGKWDLTLTAKNLLNSPGVSGVFTEQYSGSAPANNFLGDTSRQLITMPRTVALGFSYRFE